MLYERTYLDKCATIVKGSDANTGLNPVSDLIWGRNVSRMLVHFDHNKIKAMYEDKVFTDIGKLRHVLKITNAGSLDMSELYKVYASQIDGSCKKRASSFGLVFFLIPMEWDRGKGFDYTRNYFNAEFYGNDTSGYRNDDGVTWYQPMDMYTWKENVPYKDTKDWLINFHMKSDKAVAMQGGDEIEFTYYADCNGNFTNVGLEFQQVNPSDISKCEISEPLYFTKHGLICEGESKKRKYCNYVKVDVKIPANNSETSRILNFRLKYTVDGKNFSSNPYRITQLGTEDEYHPETDEGIYSTNTLAKEIQKYDEGEKSIVIGRQHFDAGTENIELDITDTFNKFITGELNNYGIGIAFDTPFEQSDSMYENYVGFLTDKTNSFFEPFVETTYDYNIEDDRDYFVLGRKNRLYLYANIGGNLENLDELPVCTINGTQYPVRQMTKGLYYAEVELPVNAYTCPTMLYDTWSSIIYRGEELNPVELSFTTVSPTDFFSIGSSLPAQNAFTPSCYGITDNERIKRGDMRKLGFTMRKNYNKNTAVRIGEIYARVYVMDGQAQCEVIPYTKIDRAFGEAYIVIDTSILIPEKYYVDVKVTYGMETIEHYDVLHFTIVGERDNKYL